MPSSAMPHSPAFPIWPGLAPGSRHVHLTESVKDPSHVFSPVKGISTPSLTPFFPEQANGTTVIVLPGGAYTQLVFDKEGSEIAEWLSQQGITAFLLKYRLPTEGHADAHLVALQDVQRAIRHVRAHAKAFGLNAAKIGVLGASSGGHLAASAGTAFLRQTYPMQDHIDEYSARPDFMLLLYGAYTGNMYFSHASREQLFFPENVKNRLYAEFPTTEQVTSTVPPTFMVAAGDDAKVSAENSTALFLALRRAGVSAQLHVYHDGAHGFALRAPASQSIAAWPEACKRWLLKHDLISRQTP
ncbi:MAG: hypothetical protein H6R19_2824 [Proteobacteria bacterium]|nr:hypothetical protein [Pseudomonadota bacterium]